MSDFPALADLQAAFGPETLRLAADIPERNWVDCSLEPPCRPRALLLPRSTEEVSRALAICHAHGQTVVIQGGLTGLAGGAVPGPDEVALSLEKMRGVEEVDLKARSLTALAGTPLEEVQQAAEAAGLHCGIDLGARGSCSIGGNIATNAGGNRVIRYGMARANLLGLEAVMADGKVLRHLNKMQKNNTGYDWPQLVAGSEGTLAVITRVTLSLHAPVQQIGTVALSLPDFDAALATLGRLQTHFPGQIQCFEVMWKPFMTAARDIVGLTLPFDPVPEVMALVELDLPQDADAGDGIMTALEDLFAEEVITDAVLATSQAQADKLWQLRESAVEYRAHGYRMLGLDISLPLDRMREAVETLHADMDAALPDVPVIVFGHAADSNIHVCALLTGPEDPRGAEVSRVTYDIVARYAGSVSAEHGIGRHKRPYLHLSRSAEQISAMSLLRRAWDPAGILNPGRVLPDAV